MSLEEILPTPESATARARLRFPSKYRASENGCWIWLASLSPLGYGQFYSGVRKVSAHRYSYELLRGPIPEGLVIDHLCRTRACVNPEHLEPVTQAENVRRGETGRYNAIKTHCRQGHEYTPENTLIVLTRGTGSGRQCKACQRARMRARYVARISTRGSQS